MTGDESDALGEIGQSLFSVMALKAGLLPSSPSPDRTGKDFLLEEHLPPLTGNSSYDKRGAPRICAVQVKATQQKKPRAVIALSVAERLAKEPHAAGIMVIVLDPAKECNSAYFIHLRGDRLAAVLRRLRQSTGSSRQLNQQKMTFTPRRSEKVEWSAAGLHSMFVGLFPDGLDGYVLAKTHELQTLGYDDRPVTYNFTVEADHADEIADGFLGLRELSVTAITAVERRFNIELPTDTGMPSTSGKLLVTPQPTDIGMLHFRDGRGEHVAIACEVLALPAALVSGSPFRVVFRWALGQFVMAEGSWNFSATDQANAGADNSIDAWLSYFRVVRMLHGPKVDIQYVSQDGRTLDFAGHDRASSSDYERFAAVIELLSILDRILKEVGAPVETTFAFQTIWDQKRHIRVLRDLQDHLVKLSFSTVDEDQIAPCTSERALLVSAAEVGSLWIGIAMPIEFSVTKGSGELHWLGYRRGSTVLELLTSAAPDVFERFKDRAQKMSGVGVVFLQRPGDFLGERTTLDLTVFNASRRVDETTHSPAPSSGAAG